MANKFTAPEDVVIDEKFIQSSGISFVDLYEQIIKGEISAAAAVKSSEQYAKGKIEDYYNVF